MTLSHRGTGARAARLWIAYQENNGCRAPHITGEPPMPHWVVPRSIALAI
jgi:hypothetical protein